MQTENKPHLNHTVKNFKNRWIPLCDELSQKILPYVKKEGLCFPVHIGGNRGGKYTVQGPKRCILKFFEKAGINNKEKGIKKWKAMGWHDLRKTFASHLAQKGVSIFKISNYLGHSSVDVTKIYAHLQVAYDVDIEKLSLGNGSQPSCNDQSTTYRPLVILSPR